MATRINLLPWRETLRKERVRQFGSTAVGAAILVCAIVFYIYWHISGMISYQDSRNKYMEDEIAAVETKIKEIRELESKKKQLLARMNVIQNLQGRRSDLVHLLDELVRVVPDGLYITSFSQKGESLSIAGMAQSNARVSAFMRSLDESEWFSDPKLLVIQAVGGGRAGRSSSFSMSVTQAYPADKNGGGK